MYYSVAYQVLRNYAWRVNVILLVPAVVAVSVLYAIAFVSLIRWTAPIDGFISEATAWVICGVLVIWCVAMAIWQRTENELHL